jgi:uncharacterized membrane protein
MSAKPRLHALDAIRGITLCSMIAYHAMWDLVYMFGVRADWYRSDAAHLWQQSICWTFILLSGFCHSLGRKPWKRGLIVFGASVLVTLVTLIFMPDQKILFGVLNLMGLSMLMMAAFAKPFAHVNPYLGTILSFAVFVLTKTIQRGVLTVFGHEIAVLPRGLYANDLTALFGFPGPGFYSTDYFPLIPWFFLYVTGWFLYRIFDRHGWLHVFEKPKIPVLGFIGRHTLPIYMAHQPVIYGVLTVVFMVLK